MPLDLYISGKKSFISLSVLKTGYRAFILFQRSCFVEMWQVLSTAGKNFLSCKPPSYRILKPLKGLHRCVCCSSNSLQAPSSALMQARHWTLQPHQARQLYWQNTTSTKAVSKAHMCCHGRVIGKFLRAWEPGQHLLLSCWFGWRPRCCSSQTQTQPGRLGEGLSCPLQCGCFQLAFGEPLVGSWMSPSPGQALR